MTILEKIGYYIFNNQPEKAINELENITCTHDVYERDGGSLYCGICDRFIRDMKEDDYRDYDQEAKDETLK
jgi:hypothetical protein